MSSTIYFVRPPALTLDYWVWESLAGTIWNGTALEAFAVANWTTYGVATADSPADSHRVPLVAPALLPAGTYRVSGYNQAGASRDIDDLPIVVEWLVRWDGTSLYDLSEWLRGWIATGIPDAAPGGAGGLPTVDADNQVAGVAASVTVTPDVYWAEVSYTRDQANQQDEWTVKWYKNAVHLTGGITGPTIRIIKRSDGTNLLAPTAMTQVGSTGCYKYDATTTARLTKGEAAVVVLTATIDGEARSWVVVRSRDT